MNQEKLEPITSEPWGQMPGGHPVTRYTLRAPSGVQARIMTHGGALVSLLTPDRQGNLADIVLGHDSLEPYLSRATAPYFGALIGRYGNRIARGQFSLGGQTHSLTLSEPPNTLHGGDRGFDLRLWQARPFVSAEGPALELTYISPDGEEGFPGRLETTVTYTLTENALKLEYRATTDAATVVNPTNHTYWNLSGDAQRDILGHDLQIDAAHFTPVDETLIPTGELRPVAGTPFDFRTPHPVGERVDAVDAQLGFTGGYDHNFALHERTGLEPACTLYDPESGRELLVLTTEPGLQVYSGNFLDGSIVGKGAQRYGHRRAMCLETQHFPDAPNQPHFPSTVLEPGQTFTSQTIYRFGTR
jgi:aldose 1-epimerase